MRKAKKKTAKTAAKTTANSKRSLARKLDYLHPDYNLDRVYEKETRLQQDYADELDFLTSTYGIS